MSLISMHWKTVFLNYGSSFSRKLNNPIICGPYLSVYEFIASCYSPKNMLKFDLVISNYHF